MNRMILLLNVIVLIVNFAVAWGATDSQIGILESTARSGGSVPSQRVASVAPAVAYLRVVQATESMVSGDAARDLDLAAIYQAVENYYAFIDAGVPTTLRQSGDGEAIRRLLANLGREARVAVESDLRRVVKDEQLVSRLATEILRQCR